MKTLGPLVPLLIAAGVLLAGNGLQGTLIALRAAEEGFDTAYIGYLGTAYFAGFLMSCIVTPRLLRAVGHIRVFAALAAITAASTLVLVLWIDPFAWMLLRLITGFSFAGLFMSVESWLNGAAKNADRARILSIYRVVDLVAVTGAQFLIPAFGVSSFAIFAIAALMINLSLVPVSLADRSNPEPPKEVKFDLKTIWAISPLACLGCITIGMTNSSFRLVGPIYAAGAGLDANGIAMFMSAGIIGGAVLQFPLGWLSDRYDRRWILIWATAGACLAALYLAHLAGTDVFLLNAGIFAFGAFSLPLYSLSTAHANDRAKPGQFVLLAAGLSFFYSLGAAAGPTIVGWVMTAYGTQYFFVYMSIVHAGLIALTLWRMSRRARPERESRGRFQMLLRTSPVFHRMARRAAKSRIKARQASRNAAKAPAGGQKPA